ncbi:FHA domain-containing protein [bacterium]|nr:FHA domain-containing protein [bacterium]
MDAYFGIIMLLGRYLFLGLVYYFVYWAFRSLVVEMRAERAAPVAAGTRAPATVAARAGAVPAPVASSAPVMTPVAAPPAAPVAATPAPAAPISTPARAPAVAPALASLVVRDPGQSGLQAEQVLSLTAAVTIGRAPDNGLVVSDRFCSQHHAMIFLQQGQRILRDRNSTNGTFHNGRPVTEDIVLRNGDQIAIGTVSFEYRSAR